MHRSCVDLRAALRALATFVAPTLLNAVRFTDEKD